MILYKLREFFYQSIYLFQILIGWILIIPAFILLLIFGIFIYISGFIKSKIDPTRQKGETFDEWVERKRISSKKH